MVKTKLSSEYGVMNNAEEFSNQKEIIDNARKEYLSIMNEEISKVVDVEPKKPTNLGQVMESLAKASNKAQMDRILVNAMRSPNLAKPSLEFLHHTEFISNKNNNPTIVEKPIKRLLTKEQLFEERKMRAGIQDHKKGKKKKRKTK